MCVCDVCLYVPSEPGGSGSSGCAERLWLSGAGATFPRDPPTDRDARNDPDLRHRAEDGDL